MLIELCLIKKAMKNQEKTKQKETMKDCTFILKRLLSALEALIIAHDISASKEVSTIILNDIKKYVSYLEKTCKKYDPGVSVLLQKISLGEMHFRKHNSITKNDTIKLNELIKHTKQQLTVWNL
jgi:hypothetical protein